MIGQLNIEWPGWNQALRFLTRAPHQGIWSFWTARLNPSNVRPPASRRSSTCWHTAWQLAAIFTALVGEAGSTLTPPPRARPPSCSPGRRRLRLQLAVWLLEQATRARTRPAAARAPLACPTCGREPTRHEAVQQREDLAIVWLHLDGDHVTEARHCVVRQPHGPVIDVSCSGCGDGPLITGQPPELGAQLAAPALDWMHSRGRQLHPGPLCPADHR
jgi:hypothetical protein